MLDLAGVEEPEVAPPAGVEIATWAERPELLRGIYAVACEAYADVPGDEDDEMPSFDDWVSMDMQGVGDSPEATFVALAGDEVVGYAKLYAPDGAPDAAAHDMTGVLRAWRGRGSPERSSAPQIAWAKQNGYKRLATRNEERNEPIRRLNARHGYRLEPGSVIVRGRI